MTNVKEKPTYTKEYNSNKNYSEQILLKLYEQQKLGNLCDVLLFNNGKTISAHSCMLALLSPYFMRYFISRMNNRDKNSSHKPFKLHISIITKCKKNSKNNCMDCVASIVTFVYTGKIQINSDHIEHIINISCNLEIDELIAFCQQFMKNCNNDNLFSNNKTEENRDRRKKKCVLKAETECENINTELSSKTEGPTRKERFKIQPNKEENSNLNLNANNRLEFSENTIFENMPLHQGIRVEPLKCIECTQSFNDNISMNNHKYVHHSKKYQCFYCNFKTYKLLCIIQHLLELNNHGNILCSICLFKSKDYESMKAHILDHRHSLPFICSVCEIRFKSRTLWSRHLLNHSMRTEFDCSICDMYFKNKTSQRMHMLNIHKTKRICCEECGYSTRFLATMERHKLKHAGKFLSCTVPGCNFKTVRKDNLEVHLNTHGVRGQHHCPVCGVIFSFQKNLKRHMKIHDPSLFPFYCPECDYVNIRHDKIKEHCLKMHSNIEGILDKISEQYLSNVKEDELLESDTVFSTKYCNTNKLKHISDKKRVSVDDKSCKVSNESEYNSVIAEDWTGNNHTSETVYLNESTGELSILCDASGKRFTSNVYTVHNISGNMSQMTFNSLGEIISVSSADRQGAVILNETTGELSYLALGIPEKSDSEVAQESVECTETMLDETTGEIMSKSEKTEVENPSVEIFDNVFDSIDIDAMNEDSFDGFDEFDDFLFETNINIGSSDSVMDKILNEVTGELFSGEVCTSNSESGPFWNLVSPPMNKEFISSNEDNVFDQIFLNEVTGEFSLIN